MTTKEQERKALEKIRKIVSDLGENSYVGTAFEGCFEIAEENIDNDFGCSMKQRAELADENSKYFQQLANTFSNELDELKEEKKRWEAERKQLFSARLYSSLQDKLIEILEDRVSSCDKKCFDITQQLIAAEPDDFQRFQEKAKKVMADRANYSNTLRQLQAIKCE